MNERNQNIPPPNGARTRTRPRYLAWGFLLAVALLVGLAGLSLTLGTTAPARAQEETPSNISNFKLLAWNTTDALAGSYPDHTDGTEVPKDVHFWTVSDFIEQVTFTLTTGTGGANAEITYDPADADENETGYQVDLSAGETVVTVTLTDGDTVRVYTNTIRRNVVLSSVWRSQSSGVCLDQIDQAVSFTVDNEYRNGYNLLGVAVYMESATGRRDFWHRFGVWTSSSNRPDTQVATLIPPKGAWQDGLVVFDVSDLHLKKGKTYWIVADGDVRTTGTASIGCVSNTTDTSSPAGELGHFGWRAGAALSRAADDKGAWSTSSSKMRVQVYAKPRKGMPDFDEPYPGERQPDVMWKSCLTVGYPSQVVDGREAPSFSSMGFEKDPDYGETYGSLTTDSFTHAGSSFQDFEVTRLTISGKNLNLTFDTAPGSRDNDWELQIGNLVFDVSDAEYVAGSDDKELLWTTMPWEWTEADNGSQVTVSIRAKRPVVEEVVVDREHLTVLFNERLDRDHLSVAAAFSLDVDGTAVTITHVGPINRSLILEAASKVTPGQTVKLSYTAPASGGLRAHSDGLFVQNVRDLPAVNMTTAGCPSGQPAATVWEGCLHPAWNDEDETLASLGWERDTETGPVGYLSNGFILAYNDPSKAELEVEPTLNWWAISYLAYKPRDSEMRIEIDDSSFIRDFANWMLQVDDQVFDLLQAKRGSGYDYWPHSNADFAAWDENSRVSVSIWEKPARALVLDPALPATIVEGSTYTYQVSLNLYPSEDVTVRITSSNTAVMTVSAGACAEEEIEGSLVVPEGGCLTFTPENWNVPQTVSVAAASQCADDNLKANLTHTVSGAEYDDADLAAHEITVTASDATLRLIRINPDGWARDGTGYVLKVSEDDEVLTKDFKVEIVDECGTPTAVPDKIAVSVSTEKFQSSKFEARAVEDYWPIETTVVFYPGETSHTLQWRTMDDDLVEKYEEARIGLYFDRPPRVEGLTVQVDPTIYYVRINSDEVSKMTAAKPMYEVTEGQSVDVYLTTDTGFGFDFRFKWATRTGAGDESIGNTISTVRGVTWCELELKRASCSDSLSTEGGPYYPKRPGEFYGLTIRAPLDPTLPPPDPTEEPPEEEEEPKTYHDYQVSVAKLPGVNRRVQFVDATTGEPTPGADPDIKFIIRVHKANLPPTLDHRIGDRRAIVGEPFEYHLFPLTFSDQTNDPLTYTATLRDGSSLPSWLTFTPSRLLFTGVAPDQEGTVLDVRVTADDGHGGQAHGDFQIRIERYWAEEISWDFQAVRNPNGIDLRWDQHDDHGQIVAYLLREWSPWGTTRLMIIPASDVDRYDGKVSYRMTNAKVNELNRFNLETHWLILSGCYQSDCMRATDQSNRALLRTVASEDLRLAVDGPTTVTEGKSIDVRLYLLTLDGYPYPAPADIPLRATATGTAIEGSSGADPDLWDYDLPKENFLIREGASSLAFTFATWNPNFEVELDETVDMVISAAHVPAGVSSIASADYNVIIKDNDVVEVRWEKVTYHINEGDELVVKIVIESANANTQRLIGFDSYAYVGVKNHGFKLNNWRIKNEPHCRPATHDLDEDIVALVTFLGYDTTGRTPSGKCTLVSVEDNVVEEHRQALFVSLHEYPGMPAGMRVNSSTTIDVRDDDETRFSLRNPGATYTVNEGDTVQVPWTLTYPVLFGSYEQAVIDTPDKDKDKIEEGQGCFAVAFTAKPAGTYEKVCIPYEVTSGTYEFTAPEVEADKDFTYSVVRTFLLPAAVITPGQDHDHDPETPPLVPWQTFTLSVRDTGNGNSPSQPPSGPTVSNAKADPDGDDIHSGATNLGAQNPDEGIQYFPDKSLDPKNGDIWDYYRFTTDARYALGLGVRGQTIDLLAYLEDSDGNQVAVSAPPKDASKDQSIEWLQTTIDAGTWYIRVTAQEGDAQTGYYLRFNLADAPNSAPTFGRPMYLFALTEDVPVGTTVGTVSATDPDGDTLTYAITAGNTGGAFAINSATGAITLATALDYETTSAYSLTVQVSDPGGASDSATVNIAIMNVDENSPPQFGSASYTFSVAEDASVGDAVGSVSATDADGDTLTYSITAGNGDSKFAIGGSNGAITVAAGLDYETTASYTLTVQASDSNGGTDTATVNIAVTDVDENAAPEFGSSSYSFSVAENAATGAAVGTVSATDADDDTLTYSITAGNGDGEFAINGSTGAVTVAAGLDYETTPSYALTVRADDGNSGQATAAVNINVTDVNEDPDGTREGAVSLGNQSPDRGIQYYPDKSLNRAGGDRVDYYVFTTDARYTLGLGVRGQSIDLLAHLEDSTGNQVAVSAPPLDPAKDQTIEWLPVTIDAGTYYIRVEAQEDGQTDYYLRFGLEAPGE